MKEKPKRSSLTGGLTESTVTLDDALKLLELPRELGTHPESEQPIVAGLGRFGPYIKHGDDYRSLEATDDLFTVDLERALALLAAPKRSARQAAEARHPQDRGARRRHALQVLEGRYGPYVTDGELNASIPKGTDPATLSLEEARALLEARRGAPPSPRRGRRAAAAAVRPRAAAVARRVRSRKAAAPRGGSKAKSTKGPAKAESKAKPKAAAKRAVRKRAS